MVLFFLYCPSDNGVAGVKAFAFLLSLAVLGVYFGSALVCRVCGVLGPVAMSNSNARLTGCDGVTTTAGASDTAAGVADLLFS